MDEDTVYVVHDWSGEYVSDASEDRLDSPARTPDSDGVEEYETYEEAEAACWRTTDRVLVRVYDEDEPTEYRDRLARRPD
jgi:hypothetical protein